VKAFIDAEKKYTKEEIESGDRVDLMAIIDRIQEGIKKVFLREYNIVVEDDSFVWSVSEYIEKFSSHMVIHQWRHCVDEEGNRTGATEMLLFRDNEMAKHLVDCLLEDDPGLVEYLDQGVYGRNRSMRIVGSSKKKTRSFLTFVQRDFDAINFEKACITWIRKEHKHWYIPVPETYEHGRKNTKKVKHKGQVPASMGEVQPSWITQRMFELLTPLHPSAVPMRAVPDENGKVRFQFADRSEPCYTGNIHDGTHDITVEVTDGSDVYAKCFSEHCVALPPHYLGPLESESTEWECNAVRVQVGWMTETLTHEACIPLYQAWKDKTVQALNLKAGMGNGKQ